jgi:hypothetical protein
MNDKDNSLVQSPTLLMIDLNDIINILRGDVTIDNNINNFFEADHLRHFKWYAYYPCEFDEYLVCIVANPMD